MEKSEYQYIKREVSGNSALVEIYGKTVRIVYNKSYRFHIAFYKGKKIAVGRKWKTIVEKAIQALGPKNEEKTG